MPEHLSAQLIARYGRRALSPAELLAADDHLAICAACRQRASEAGNWSAACAALRADLRQAASAAPEHLGYEQIVAYVDHALDETAGEIVESHLESCRQCFAEVEDLRAFKAALEVNVDALSSEAARAIMPAPFITRWDRFVAFWRAPAHWIPLQVAATALIAALCVWLATHSLRTQVTDLHAQLHQLEQTNLALQQEANAAKTTAAHLQTELAQIQLPPISNPPALTLNDGDKLITLDQSGHLTGLAALPPAAQQAVKTALTAQQVTAPPALAELIGKNGTLLGETREGVAFPLNSPVGTMVLNDRPTFRWSPLDGATSYRVTVYDANFDAVATSQALTTITWTPPHALPRGAIYSWQVTALVNGQEIKSPRLPAPEAKFKVLAQAPVNELERIKKTAGNSPLTLGVLYAQAGLLDEAEREFQSLLKANPQSPVARKLWRSVKRMKSKR